jgi:hypothetical protein
MLPKEKAQLKKLIKEAVKAELLQENLFNVFMEPFTDIIKTAKAGVERIAGVGFSELVKSIKMFAYMVIPFVSTKVMRQLRQDTQRAVEEKLSKIDSKYADVYERNYEAFKKSDLFSVAFLMNPQTVLGTQLAKKATTEVLETLDAIVGGSKIIQSITEKLGKITAAGGIEITSPSGLDSIFGFDAFGESSLAGKSLKTLLYEQNRGAGFYTPEEVESYILNTVVPRINKDQSFSRKITNNPINKELRKAGEEIILSNVREVMNLKTYEELKKYFGDDFKKYEAELEKKMPENLSEEENKKFREKLVPEIKEVYKDIYIKQLEREKGVVGLDRIITQIKSM